MRGLVLILALVLAAPAFAQESKLRAEFRREGERLAEHCDGVAAKALMSCAMTVVTDHPLHLSLGSLAPGNGFALGPAFVMHHNPNEFWRLGWSADVVATPRGAWRAGGYMSLVHIPDEPIVVVTHPAGARSTRMPTIRPYTVIDLYGQVISLKAVTFYGLGAESAHTGRSEFGFRETIVGARVTAPETRLAISRRLNLALVGEINGRFSRVRSGDRKDAPSIEDLYSEADAPGLGSQPAVLQLVEGLRVAPAILDGRVQLDYRLQFQQFVAPSARTSSFRRWTVDLQHEVPIYRSRATMRTPETNTPNDCSVDPGTGRCAPISGVRDRYGAVQVRLYVSRSGASGAGSVPFYFQETIGGSDVNGRRALDGYDDGRFRGQNVLLVQESVEHSMYGPIGLRVAAEHGSVARRRDPVGHGDVKHSFSIGLTIRAGGVPMIVVSQGWSRGEGRHVAITMNTSLIGGGRRPSLQ